MSFYVLDYFKTEVGFCTIEDITDLVHIPPPEFVMSASPSSATLRSGDEENVQLQLKSTGKLNSHLVLSTNRIDDNIETNFMPKQISVPHSGMATSRLHVKVLENASIGTHTIPIVANISFPTILENRFSSEIFNNPTSVNIFEYSNFTITVLSPFTFGEQLDNFYKAWLSPISGLWTFLAGVAAVIAPLVIRLYSKRQNKGKYKKLSDWFNREK
jgi:hypothetical protein